MKFKCAVNNYYGQIKLTRQFNNIQLADLTFFNCYFETFDHKSLTTFPMLRDIIKKINHVGKQKVGFAQERNP